MTIREIASKLASQGYSVRYRVRKDGGVLITSINNQKFTAAAGNKVARQIVGENISQKREVQLEKITRERTDVENMYNQFRRVKRKWTKGNLPKTAGKLSFKKFKRAIKEKGKEEALKYLGEKEKYAVGIAYSKNVQALADYFDQLATSLDAMGEDGSEFNDLADLIRANDGNIRDEDLLPAYEEGYRINTEPLTDQLIKDIVRNVRRILKI